MMNPFCISAVGRWQRPGPKLSMIVDFTIWHKYNNGYSDASDPRKKSIMKFYKLRRRAICRRVGGSPAGVPPNFGRLFSWFFD